MYLAVAAQYRTLSDAHLTVCREIERRYDERLIARHEAGALGTALLSDRADYLWESSVAD